jgi:thermitase
MKRKTSGSRLIVAGFGLASLLALSLVAVGSGVSANAAVSDRPEVIVQLAPGTNIASINAAFGTITLDSLAAVPGSHLLRIPAGSDPEVVAEAIAATPGVTLAQPNGAINGGETDASRWMFSYADSSPTLAANQYAESLLNLAAVRQRTRGAGVVVAVLDTGVQANHPDLANALSGVRVDFVDNDSDPADTQNGFDDDGDGLIDEAAGHGTHVAGIVHRVAPDAKIMPIRVLNSDGSGDVWSATRGLYFASDNGAKIINMSLGAKGVKTYPAATKCAIAVAASGAANAVSSYSTVDSWVDVAAPGDAISSAYPFNATGYASWSGTSMASPFVAGQAALLVGVNAGLRPNDVYRLVVATATPVSNPGPKTPSRIDIVASLDRANNLASLAGVSGLDDRCF